METSRLFQRFVSQHYQKIGAKLATNKIPQEGHISLLSDRCSPAHFLKNTILIQRTQDGFGFTLYRTIVIEISRRDGVRVYLTYVVLGDSYFIDVVAVFDESLGAIMSNIRA